jgi:hypothetical protein
MVDSPDKDTPIEVPVQWNLPSGPAPLVNHFILQQVPDSDRGPAEILVRLGYVSAPPVPLTAMPLNEPLQVTTVASFALTRHRAQELVGYLTEQIDTWDKVDAAIRGERKSDDRH